MRKVGKYFAMFLLCVLLTSCASKDLLSDTSIINYGLNETVYFEDLAITAKEIVELSPLENDFIEIEKGEAHVSVRFEIENISDDDESVTSLGMFKAYADGEEADLSLMGTAVYDKEIIDGTLNAGESKTGWFTVKVPREWKELVIFVKSGVIANDYVKFTFKN